MIRKYVAMVFHTILSYHKKRNYNVISIHYANVPQKNAIQNDDPISKKKLFKFSSKT